MEITFVKIALLFALFVQAQQSANHAYQVIIFHHKHVKSALHLVKLAKLLPQHVYLVSVDTIIQPTNVHSARQDVKHALTQPQIANLVPMDIY